MSTGGSARASATDTRPSLAARARGLNIWAELAAPVGLVVLVIIFASLSDSFLGAANIENLLVAGAVLVILAVGQTFVVATGGIDLSLASSLALSAVAFGLSFAAGTPVGVCVLIAMATGALFGLLQGLAIGKGGLPDFIVTLGGLSVAMGLALVLSGGRPVTVVNAFLLRFSVGSLSIIGWPVLVALVVAVIAHITLFHTRAGLHILAAGGSAEAANATGISVARVKIGVYTLAGLLAGLASVLLIARLGAASPVANTQLLLDSVAAVVLGGVALVGGRATVVGPVVGAVLLTTLTNGLTLLGVSEFYQPVATGLIVVLAAFLSRFQR